LVGVSTTSLEGAHLVVVDLVVHLVAQRVGNFSDRPWGISVILVSVAIVDPREPE
jgi:steroid 5-alpha reductase family enzyme